MKRIHTAAVRLTTVAVIAQEPKFYPDDPLLRDDDTLETPRQPGEIELSDLSDRFSHVISRFRFLVWGKPRASIPSMGSR